MFNSIARCLQNSKKKTIDTRLLEQQVYQTLGEGYHQAGGYTAFVKAVSELIEQGSLVEVKSSGSNGRVPSLFNRYKKVTQERFDRHHSELLSYHPRMNMRVYRNKADLYETDKLYLRALDSFLKCPDLAESLKYPYSINERSYQIFGDEKFLAGSRGRALLAHIGIAQEQDLNCYNTYEPFFYVDYRHVNNRAHEVGVHVLVVENKDTFFTLKKVFSEYGSGLWNDVFQLLIYGEGRKIVKSFSFIDEVLNEGGHAAGRRDIARLATSVYYFGDLDKEGIDIFGELAERYPAIDIRPHVFLYRKLLNAEKELAARHLHNVPVRSTKQKVRPNRLTRFLAFFDSATTEVIKKRLETGNCLPQEALAYPFFVREARHHA